MEGFCSLLLRTRRMRRIRGAMGGGGKEFFLHSWDSVRRGIFLRACVFMGLG
jgi:hypothetical protein